MLKRTPLVYMVSPMASTCETYRQSEQKQSRKFCRSKEDKNGKTHPEKPEKGETGCVFGAGGDGNGWKQIKTGTKTSSLNQNESHSHTIRAKRKPARIQCFRRFCGRGRRTWSRLPARVLLPGGERPAPTGAGAETGSRFWSGCRRALARTEESRCRPVPAASPRERC